MKMMTTVMALWCAWIAAPAVAAAQELGPPKVLVIQREYLKPGRAGTLHEKTEGGFMAAVKAGKAPIHYFALTSLSGPDRALFLSGYPSFAAWEAEHKSVGPAVGAAMDKAMVPDGDLLASSDSSVWMLRPDLSLNIVTLKGIRYFEMQQFMIKPGHRAEFNELTHLYQEAFKNVPGMNWTAFENVYGTNGDVVLGITLLASLAEVDREISGSDAALAALSKDQRKKVRELTEACLESQQTNLFAVSPKMSLPMDEWVAADREFWTPKTAPVKKPAAKTAK